MSNIVEVLYTAQSRTTGAREYGAARSADGHLDIKLSTPGSERIGANPEQLFAAAWSASFESAVALAAHQRKIAFQAGLAIEAEVDLCLNEPYVVICWHTSRLVPNPLVMLPQNTDLSPNKMQIVSHHGVWLG